MKTAAHRLPSHQKPSAAPTQGQSKKPKEDRAEGRDPALWSAAHAPTHASSGVVQRRTEQAFGTVQRQSDVPRFQADGRARADDTQQIHQVAAQGTSGSGSPLPYLQQIQASFGRFDVRGVQAYTGQRASQAAQQMGASAFTVGNRVAFAGTPSLHTAAHEAAHAVQQQAGVQLKGGVGQQGDPYERHADAVADAVVAGRSAEPILAAAPSGGGSTRAVQCRKTVGFEFQAGNAHIFQSVEEVEKDDASSATGKKKELERTDDEVEMLPDGKKDPTKAEGMAKHAGSFWVEHRRIGQGGTGKGGGIRSDQWFDAVKPVIEASSGEALPERKASKAVQEVGAQASTDLVYARDDSDPIVDLTSHFKCTGDGSELEIVTIPAEDSADKMKALFSALEAYVNGLDGQAAKWYRVASLPKKGAKKGVLSYKDEQLKLTKVKNGYIGVNAGQRIKARPQTTFSLDISKFPEQLKTFSRAEHYREAKTGATTQKPLAKLAAVDRSTLPEAFAAMSADTYGMLMYIAHIVIVARSSAPDSLGKDLAALAPRTSLRTELSGADRKKAFTDENMLAILTAADSTITLDDPLALKDSKAARLGGKTRNPKPHTTIKEYFTELRSDGKIKLPFLSRIIGGG